MRAGIVSIVLGACLALAAPAGAADPLRPYQWGLSMVRADGARATATGAGATVAVIDSGAAMGHPDLQGRLVAGPDYVDGGAPEDGEGHGTHVAGIVAANAGNGVGVESVAPGARVLVVRVLDDDGEGGASGVADGIRWAADNGADVINLSLGSEIPIFGTSEDYESAIDYALDRGKIVVAAAGNGATPAGAPLPFCDQPSAEGRLLCVGAVDRDENRAYYSNYGDGLGITAPGGSAAGPAEDDILSTTPARAPTLLAPGHGFYGYMAGTSQASPHVAGVAALLVSRGVRGQAAVQRILATARDVGPAGPDETYGAGIVDAQAAVAGLAPSGGAGAGGGGAGTGTGTGGGDAGGGTGGATGTPGSAARIAVSRLQRLRTVLRRGLYVGCTATGRGRCRVLVLSGRRLIASGSRAVTIGRRTLVTARLTRRGHTILRAALRRRRTVTASVRVTLPGTRTIRRTVYIRP
ncbi:MAG TPA: S8 family serine peptidase [Solirubrobacteraceae bacterium]|nr:S8 family serine peptidase [Solirubrobacteraceae bacterium]